MAGTYLQYPPVISSPVSIANGGTGATTAAGALANLGAANQQLSNLSGTVAPNLQIGLIAGSAAAPSLSFQGDLDTGLYHPTANAVSMAINGVEGMTLGLNVFGGETLNFPQNFSGINIFPGAATPFLGIGWGNAIAIASDFYQTGISVYTPESIFGGPVFSLQSSAGTIAAPLTTTDMTGSGNTMGGVAWHGYDTNGYQFNAFISAAATENWTTTAHGTLLQFGAVKAGTTAEVNFLILKEGDVRAPIGNIIVDTAGKGLQIKEGSNAKMGTSVLVAGAVVVANTSVTASSRIFLTSQVDGGVPGFLRVSTRTAATSFTITSSSVADTSTVAWMLIEPA